MDKFTEKNLKEFLKMRMKLLQVKIQDEKNYKEKKKVIEKEILDKLGFCMFELLTDCYETAFNLALDTATQVSIATIDKTGVKFLDAQKIPAKDSYLLLKKQDEMVKNGLNSETA